MPARFYLLFLFFFNDTATTEIYTLSLHDALPISITNSRESTSIIISMPPGKMLLVVISRSLWECHMKAKPASSVGLFATVPDGGIGVLPTARVVAFGPR